MLAAIQMNEQPLENTFVPQDQDLVHWSSYLKKKKNAYYWVQIISLPFCFVVFHTLF